MNHRAPDNDDLARLIATSFDALPGPDEERLEAVRTRLESQLKRPTSRSHGKRWFWLLLLAGGTATAAWWASEYQLQQRDSALNGERPAVIQQQLPSSGSKQPAKNDGGSDSKAGISRDSSPIIYRRERE